MEKKKRKGKGKKKKKKKRKKKKKKEKKKKRKKGGGKEGRLGTGEGHSDRYAAFPGHALCEGVRRAR